MNDVAEHGTATANKRHRVAMHREVAAHALEQYCMSGAKLTLLHHAENTVFRVDVAPDAAPHPYMGRVAGKRFVLRVHASEEQAAPARSELVWLAALLRDTALTVPEPVPTAHGSLLAAASHTGEEVGACVMLHWVDGSPHDEGLHPNTIGNVGRYMAELHLHAESFAPPPGFTRPSWDWNRLFGAGSVLHIPHASRHFTPEALHLFGVVSERVGRAIQELGRGKQVYGLIHADLHRGNYLFHNGEVRSINFGDCGWGYYLYDIAVTLSELRRHADYPVLRAAFLEGYRAVRPLAPEHEALLDTFMLARSIDMLNWILSWEDPHLRPWAPRFIEKTLEEMGRDE